MNILCIGAHSDDVEIGAGALIFKLKDKHNIRYICLSKCSDLERNKNLMDEYNKVIEFMGVDSKIYDIPNRKFPENAFIIRQILEEEKVSFNPDIVITHSSFDIHQDHNTVYKEVFRVFRNITILGMENVRACPVFKPNFFVLISKKELDNKIKILKMYKSQQLYYNQPNIHSCCALMMGARIGKLYAEGFEAIRIINMM